MNWLKENWFKLGILIVALIGVVLFSFNFNKNNSETVNESGIVEEMLTTEATSSDAIIKTEIDKLKEDLANEIQERKSLEIDIAQSQSQQQEVVVTSAEDEGISKDLLEKIMTRVVPIKCLGPAGVFEGSGTTQLVENDDPVVVTNFHVVNVGPASNSACTINIPQPPDYTKGDLYEGQRGKFSPYFPSVDVALLHIKKPEVRDTGLFTKFPIPGCKSSQIGIGTKMLVLGYPSFGGETLTVTDGTISGILPTAYGPIYKTSAKMDYGVSGGLAISTEHKCVIGIPTWGKFGGALGNYGIGEALGQIQSWEIIVNYGEII